jgi:N-acetylneuraminic acid mutarotase
MKSHLLLITTILLSALRAVAMPSNFTWQGRLSDASGPVNGVYSMIFILHDQAEGGDGIATSVHEEVTVTGGLFTVALTFPEQHLNGGDRWLAIHLRRASDVSGPLIELTPRQAINPAPYALMAKSVPNGSITAQKIAPGAIGATQLAPGAVTAAAVAPGSLTGNLLAAGSISGGLLAPGAALENLAVTGHGLVPGGGVILSEYAWDSRLLDAGYNKLGRTDLVPEEWLSLGGGWSAPLVPMPEESVRSQAGYGQASVWTGTDWLFFGGKYLDHDYGNYSGVRYNPAANQWTRMNPTGAPSPRIHASAVWTGSEMIVWGGVYQANNSGQISYYSDGARYNPVTDTWTALSSTGAASARSNHTAVWTGSEMIVWGGVVSDGFSTYLNSGGRYNPVTNTWSPMTLTAAPAGRTYHAAVWTGSAMLVVGGYGGSSNPFPTAGGRYNPATNSWTALPVTNGPGGRANCTAVWTGTEMIVWGGSYTDAADNVIYYNTGARYSPSTNAWTATATAGAPTGRRDHTAVWTGSRMLIWGGSVGSWSYVNTGGSYNPSTNAWSAITTTAAPAARSNHSAAWTGSQMLIFGGNMEPGGRYSPTSNSWTNMAVSGDVRPREDYSVVWSGSEMILWGGRSPFGDALRSGYRFNMKTRKWSVTSGIGAPAARYRHSAVWTGDSMIVWGGESSGGRFSDGARYFPATDTWVPLTIDGAPSARHSHSAVWTGSEMIVWGGRAPSVTATGGRYHAATGVWSPLDPVGAPGARYGHKAFWTGTEMIVWGGINDTGSPMTNGSRFHPGNGTWTFLPASGAPSLRTNDSAVWTGSELIVWGGRYNGTDLATGARYNIATNSWQAMRVPDLTVSLSARHSHCAVWAGTQMVVWGGFEGTDGVTGGAVYIPQFDQWKSIASGASASYDAPTTGTHAGVWSGSEVLLWGGMETGQQNLGIWAYVPARTLYLYMRP